jgi:hypothetical protein
VEEVNKLRTTPEVYMGKLSSTLGRFRGDLLLRPRNTPVKTREGIEAVNEAL